MDRATDKEVKVIGLNEKIDFATAGEAFENEDYLNDNWTRAPNFKLTCEDKKKAVGGAAAGVVTVSASTSSSSDDSEGEAASDTDESSSSSSSSSD